ITLPFLPVLCAEFACQIPKHTAWREGWRVTLHSLPVLLAEFDKQIPYGLMCPAKCDVWRDEMRRVA
ncbi:MAG: hypothetical protein II505_08865, partial [Bacteroidaceae bacterium]|nr:hypothetical protein [Bacteroidaceae bacterium]